MSRIGKHPVEIPAGVTVELAHNSIKAIGKLGELSFNPSDSVVLSVENNQVIVRPKDETQQSRMQWGTARNIVRNLIEGVSQGFTINLDIFGVGYKAAMQGDDLVMQLGFSHEVRYKIPKGITVKCEKPTSISVHGADRQLVGQVAAEIRGYKKPEPYKGKGIMYENEKIIRKEGKKK